MLYPNPTTFYRNAGRWMAIAAMSVLVCGKLVHLGQESAGCCSGSHCHVEADSSPQPKPCPFGCLHHEQPENGTHSEGHEPCPDGHDEHHCSICTVLAHVTESTAIVDVPDESRFVVETMPFDSASSEAAVFFPVHPRGPPSKA